jgi:hypothetical protein
MISEKDLVKILNKILIASRENLKKKLLGFFTGSSIDLNKILITKDPDRSFQVFTKNR